MNDDQRQWRIVWSAPNEPDEVAIVTRFRRAWAIAVAPARIENDPVWAIPYRIFVWDCLQDNGPDTMLVASHEDGRQITLTLL